MSELIFCSHIISTNRDILHDNWLLEATIQFNLFMNTLYLYFMDIVLLNHYILERNVILL